MRNSKKKTDEIIEKIEAEKEVLKTMPKNNPKNIAKYLDKIEQLKKEYNNLLDKTVKEMQKRYEIAIDVQSDKEIEKKELKSGIYDFDKENEIKQSNKKIDSADLLKQMTKYIDDKSKIIKNAFKNDKINV